MELLRTPYVDKLLKKKPSFENSPLHKLYNEIAEGVDPNAFNLERTEVVVASDSDLLGVINKVVLFGYNSWYTNGNCDVLDPKAENKDGANKNITLAVVQNMEKPVPLGTFQIDTRCTGIREFFITDGQLEPDAAEFVSFATHGVIEELDRTPRIELKQGILRRLWTKAFEITRELKIAQNYFIMAPHVFKFVTDSGIQAKPMNFMDNHTEEADAVRQKWAKYWQPEESIEFRPQVYRALEHIKKNDE